MNMWKQLCPRPLLAALAFGTVIAGGAPTQSLAQVAPPPDGAGERITPLA